MGDAVPLLFHQTSFRPWALPSEMRLCRSRPPLPALTETFRDQFAVTTNVPTVPFADEDSDVQLGQVTPVTYFVVAVFESDAPHKLAVLRTRTQWQGPQ